MGGRQHPRGGIHDLSGGLELYGKPMADALISRRKEINEKGGLLGKQIQLITQDPQSNMQQYAQIAAKMALGDKVAVRAGRDDVVLARSHPTGVASGGNALFLQYAV